MSTITATTMTTTLLITTKIFTKKGSNGNDGEDSTGTVNILVTIIKATMYWQS